MKKEEYLARFRDFGLFEIIKNFENKDPARRNVDEISNIISFLGNNACGEKINDLIPHFGIYPNIDPDEVFYSIPKEEHFWILAKDCTAMGIAIKKSNFIVVIVYKPIYEFYPTKYYRYIYPLNKIERKLKEILTKTEAPLIIYDEKSFSNLITNSALLKLIKIRSQRRNLKLFKPSLDEKTILKMKENCDILKSTVETIWIPRKEKKLIDNCILFSTGSCIFCLSVDNVLVNGSIIDNGKVKTAIIYQICKNCIKNMQDKTIYEKFINHISKHCLEFNKHKFIYLSQNDYFDLIVDKLNKENLQFKKQIKKNGKELHITFKNGSLLIIRYNHMLDYAYVFRMKGKELFRWDSARHHKLEAGPDHFHYDLKNYNKNVKSSYLIGNFLIDFNTVFKKIRHLLYE